MIDHPLLRELRELLAAFVERPLAGALVLGCCDEGMIHIVHTLDALDGDSPADRFLLHFEPFITAESYVDQLVAHVTNMTSCPPIPAGTPLARINALFAALLTALPHGDYRLVVVLFPRHISDPVDFSDLASSLLDQQHPHPFRLVLRDDLKAPRHLLSAEASPSEQLIGYRFHISATALVEASTAAARNPNASPDLRAQSLIQLATLALAKGHIEEAVTACKAAVGLTDNPVLLALALAFHADALRGQKNHQSAVISALAALEHAVSCGATPVVHHASITLGELSLELGRPKNAAACFALAKRTAPPSTDQSQHPRAPTPTR